MKSNTNASSIEDLTRFWQLVMTKVRFNLRSEASQSYLSYAWWLLEPLLQMGVYLIVFDIFLHRGTENFVAFLLCGVIPWLWFSKSVSQAGNSITQGKGLISQTYLPKPFFPLVIIGQAFVKQTFVFGLLIVFLLIYGFYPNIWWLWLVPIIFVQLLLITAVSFVVAFIVPFARDLLYLINAGLIMMMFGSGIFYSYKDVLIPEHREIFLMNPMANLIADYRLVLMEGSLPMRGSLVVIALVSLLVILLMSRVMKRHNNTLTRLALE